MYKKCGDTSNFDKYSEITKDMVRRGEGAGVGTNDVTKTG